MPDTIEPISYTYACSQKTLFEELCDNSKSRKWFPELYVTGLDTPVDIEKLKIDGIKYIVRIQNTKPYSFIAGIIESIDNSGDTLTFEWVLDQNDPAKNWTHLTMNFNEPQTIRQSKWWAVTPLGALPFLKLFEENIASIPQAYAEAIVESTAITTPPSPISSTTSSPAVNTPVSTVHVKHTVSSWLLLSIAIVGVVITSGLLVPPYLSYNALQEMEHLIVLANEQYKDGSYDASLNTFQKAGMIFDRTWFQSDHVNRAEYLHLLSLTGSGDSFRLLDVKGNAEQIYLKAISMYESKASEETISRVWVGLGLNIIYENPIKSIEHCNKHKSINGYMCAGDASIILYKEKKQVSLKQAQEYYQTAISNSDNDPDVINNIIQSCDAATIICVVTDGKISISD